MPISITTAADSVHIHKTVEVYADANGALIIKDGEWNTAFWHIGNVAAAEAIADAWRAFQAAPEVAA